ncbi:MAG: hypothetical protein GWN86_03495, partial [Desulfobacterales bacterium]|nr:hypothetical protein [Desulfobacterales bacterium]
MPNQGVEESGIRLVIEQFSQYMKRLREIEKGHRQAFKRRPEVKQTEKDVSDLGKSVGKAGAEAQKSVPFWKKLGNIFKKSKKDTAASREETERFAKAWASMSKKDYGRALGVFQDLVKVLGSLNRALMHFGASFRAMGINVDAGSEKLSRMAAAGQS